MNPKHFLRSIAFAFVILLASCSKESSPNITTPPPRPNALNLVADDWVQQSYSGLYVNPFLGIMQNRYAAAVYLEDSGSEILLTSYPTSYMTGELWITINSSDLILNFRDHSGDPIPFTRINIKVVFKD